MQGVWRIRRRTSFAVGSVDAQRVLTEALSSPASCGGVGASPGPVRATYRKVITERATRLASAAATARSNCSIGRRWLTSRSRSRRPSWYSATIPCDVTQGHVAPADASGQPPLA